MVNESGIHAPKESLQSRAKAWFRGWTLVLAHAIQSQELLEVGASEFGTAIYCNGRWESPISLDSHSHHHHAGTVRRCIECQIVGGNASTMRKNHQGQPAFANGLPRF